MKHIQGNAEISIINAKADSATLLVGIPQNTPKFLKCHTVKITKREPKILSVIAHMVIYLEQIGKNSMSGVEFSNLLDKYTK